jgi:hypothetical protein
MYTDLPWDLEERVEDALVAHIQNACGDALVIASRGLDEVVYPLIVVECGESDNSNDDATFNGLRRMSVLVVISTEALPNDIKTAMENHRRVKTAVIESLAVPAFHDYLNAQGHEGVQFSMAHITRQSRDVSDQLMITEQLIDVIAAPKALG